MKVVATLEHPVTHPELPLTQMMQPTVQQLLDLLGKQHKQYCIIPGGEHHAP